MNGLRNSIFNKGLVQLEKNEITKKFIYWVIKIGLGDFTYRIFSQKYLKDRQAFYRVNEERIRQNINILEDETSKIYWDEMICF